MKKTNWRFVITGCLAIALALGFFLFMGSMAPQSTDPKAMMETVGQASGVAGALGIVLIVLGFMGRKF